MNARALNPYAVNARAMNPCLAVQPHLEAFADGELRGDVLRRVSQHVETCPACSGVVESVRAVGGALRDSQATEADLSDLSGLADGVVSRVRAEDHESWRGKLERATDDLHWVLVGAGSIAAAFLSVLLVSVVMQSSVEQRGDSLASMLKTMQLQPPLLGIATEVPPGIVASTGMDDVEFVNLTEVNRAGHVTFLQPVILGNEINASEAQVLVDQLRALRFSTQTEPSKLTDPDARQFIWLYTTTEVRPRKANVL